MQAIVTIRMRLTYDMYKRGVAEVYRSSHMVLRAVSTAYAIILFGLSLLFLDHGIFVLCMPFAVLGFAVLFWNCFGYRLGTKRSFMEFAGVHHSHYYVDMEYRFYQNRVEQETEKTTLAVFYKDISKLFDFGDILVIEVDGRMMLIEKAVCKGDELQEIMQLLQGDCGI